MNQRLYQTEKFALNYYNKLYKAKHAIDNSSPNKSNIPYSSRNTSHMARYEEQLKTKKLLNKLIQINEGNDNHKKDHVEIIDSECKILKRKANKILCKSKRQKQQKINISRSHALSFNNPPVIKQKSLQAFNQNINLVGRLFDIKSIYGQCFSKQRDHQLKKYKKILAKKDNELKQENHIRNNIFQVYQKIKLTEKSKNKRPQSSKSNKRRKLIKVQQNSELNYNQTVGLRPTTAKI